MVLPYSHTLGTCSVQASKELSAHKRKKYPIEDSLRARRLALARERWQRCELRAVIQEAFAKWRSLARRSAAMKDAANCLIRARKRCKLLECWEAWRSFALQRLCTALAVLRLRRRRTQHVLNRWACSRILEIRVRLFRTSVYFIRWIHRIRWKVKVRARCAAHEFTRAATILQKSFLYWRSACMEQHVTLRVALATAPFVLATWHSFVQLINAERISKEVPLLQFKQRSSLKIWRFRTSCKLSLRKIFTATLLGVKRTGFFFWLKAASAAKGFREQCVATFLVQRSLAVVKRCMKAFQMMLTRLKLSHSCIAVLKSRRRAILLRAWSQVSSVISSHGSQHLEARAQAFTAWQQQSQARSCWRRRRRQLVNVHRSSRTSRALRCWNSEADRRRACRTLKETAQQHYVRRNLSDALGGWNSQVVQRQQRFRAQASCRRTMLQKTASKAVLRWLDASSSLRRQRRLLDASREHRRLVVTCSVLGAWRGRAQLLKIQRRWLQTAVLNNSSSLALTCFSAWRSAMESRRDIRLLLRRLLQKRFSILIQTILLAWYNLSVAEGWHRQNSWKAMVLFSSKLVGKCFKAIAGCFLEGKRIRQSGDASKVSLRNLRRRQVLVAFLNFAIFQSFSRNGFREAFSNHRFTWLRRSFQKFQVRCQSLRDHTGIRNRGITAWQQKARKGAMSYWRSYTTLRCRRKKTFREFKQKLLQKARHHCFQSWLASHRWQCRKSSILRPALERLSLGCKRIWFDAWVTATDSVRFSKVRAAGLFESAIQSSMAIVIIAWREFTSERRSWKAREAVGRRKLEILHLRSALTSLKCHSSRERCLQQLSKNLQDRYIAGLSKLALAAWVAFLDSCRQMKSLMEKSKAFAFRKLQLNWFELFSFVVARELRHRHIVAARCLLISQRLGSVALRHWKEFRNWKARERHLLPAACNNFKLRVFRELLRVWQQQHSWLKERGTQLASMLMKLLCNHRFQALFCLRNHRASYKLWIGVKAPFVLAAWRCQAQWLKHRNAAITSLATWRRHKHLRNGLQQLADVSSARRHSRLAWGIATSQAHCSLLKASFQCWSFRLQELKLAREAAKDVVQQQVALVHWVACSCRSMLLLWRHGAQFRQLLRNRLILARSSKASCGRRQAVREWRTSTVVARRIRNAHSVILARFVSSIKAVVAKAWSRYARVALSHRRILQEKSEHLRVLLLRTALQRWFQYSRFEKRVRSQLDAAVLHDSISRQKRAFLLLKTAAKEEKKERFQMQLASKFLSSCLCRSTFLLLAKYLKQRRRDLRYLLSAKVQLSKASRQRGLIQLAANAMARKLKKEESVQLKSKMRRHIKRQAFRILVEFSRDQQTGKRYRLLADGVLAARGRLRVLNYWRQFSQHQMSFRKLALSIKTRCQVMLQRNVLLALSMYRMSRRQTRQLRKIAEVRLRRSCSLKVFSHWQIHVESIRRKRNLAIRSATFCDSALRALAFINWKQRWFDRSNLKSRGHQFKVILGNIQRRNSFRTFKTCVSQLAATRSCRIRADIHRGFTMRSTCLSIWAPWAHKTRLRREQNDAFEVYKNATRTASTLRFWRRVSARFRRNSIVLREALFTIQAKTLAAGFWAIEAYRAWRLRKRRLSIASEAVAHRQLARAAWRTWADNAAAQRLRSLTLSGTLTSITLTHYSSILQKWRLTSLTSNLSRRSALFAFTHWKQLTWNLHLARSQAIGPIRSRNLRKLALRFVAESFDVWHCFVVSERHDRLLEALLRTHICDVILAPCLKIWRLHVFIERGLQSFSQHALTACVASWRSWAEKRPEGRRFAAAAKLSLQCSRAFRRWRLRSASTLRMRRLTNESVALCQISCLARFFRLAWQTVYKEELAERRRFALRASFRQWHKWTFRQVEFRIALLEAFQLAAEMDAERTVLATFRWWNWQIAWSSANLEASARLVEENRKNRERRSRQRRLEVGPTVLELELMQAAFGSWKFHFSSIQQLVLKTTREVARQHGALLLISLDHWVEAVLPPHRAENLQRRRHVRFALHAPSVPVGTESSTTPRAADRSASAAAVASQPRGPFASPRKSLPLTTASIQAAKQVGHDSPIAQEDLRRRIQALARDDKTKASAQTKRRGSMPAALTPPEEVVVEDRRRSNSGNLSKPEALTTPNFRRPSLPSGRRQSTTSVSPAPKQSMRRASVSGGLGNWARNPPQRSSMLATALALSDAAKEDDLRDSEDDSEICDLNAPSEGSDQVSVSSMPKANDADRRNSVRESQAVRGTEGTGGTSTPAVCETPARNTPAGTPRDGLHQASATTLFKAGSEISEPVTQLQSQEQSARFGHLRVTPPTRPVQKILQHAEPPRYAAHSNSLPGNNDILRFFKMK